MPKTQINIANLRHKVALQGPTRTSDGAGGYTEAFNTIANLFADIRPQNALESYRQGQIQEKVTHKIIIRYRTDIQTNYKIVDGSQTYMIKGIKNINNRNRFLELYCEEGVAA